MWNQISCSKSRRERLEVKEEEEEKLQWRPWSEWNAVRGRKRRDLSWSVVRSRWKKLQQSGFKYWEMRIVTISANICSLNTFVVSLRKQAEGPVIWRGSPNFGDKSQSFLLVWLERTNSQSCLQTSSTIIQLWMPTPGWKMLPCPAAFIAQVSPTERSPGCRLWDCPAMWTKEW